MTRSAPTRKTARAKTPPSKGSSPRKAKDGPKPDPEKIGSADAGTVSTRGRGGGTKPGPRSAGSASAANDSLAAVSRLVEQLGAALGDLPRASDFEPLAEHLYAFAQAAPNLDESLRTLPEAIRTLHEALRQVHETTSTLDYLHSSFSLAFLKLPSAADYEPLVEPLLTFARSSPVLLARLEETLLAVTSLTQTLADRPPAEELRLLAEPAKEFALVAPALSEALSRLPPLVEPLTRSLSGLAPLADRMHAAADRMSPGAVASGERAAPALALDIHEAVVARISAARQAILEAIATLPRGDDYAPFAQQLREVASVSPSLLAWLNEVPNIQTPLVSSVRALLAAAEGLEEARRLLLADNATAVC